MAISLMIPNGWLVKGLDVEMPLTRSDAIVLMGGSFKERIPTVAMLFRDGYAPVVMLVNDGIFSSWSPKHNRNLYQVEWAEEGLVKLGVPREKIIKLPFYGSSTMHDALAVRQYLYRSGYRNLLLVTSDYHTRRTLWTFRWALKDYRSQLAVYPARSFSLKKSNIALEYTKLLYYALRFGVLGMLPDVEEIPLKGFKST